MPLELKLVVWTVALTFVQMLGRELIKRRMVAVFEWQWSFCWRPISAQNELVRSRPS